MPKKPKRRKRRKRPLAIAGWREWVNLPDLGIGPIKAKLDTGARSSSLHAFGLEGFDEDGREMLRFKVHPLQRDTSLTIEATAEVVDRRVVRNSGGQSEERPVIHTALELGEDSWPIELTLTRRDEMGFRMLLGRQAFRDRFAVDAGRSFRIWKPKDVEAAIKERMEKSK